MTLEIIAFIASILFGVVWYWRESQGNKLYRFFNKIMNSKELQMKATDKKGFVFQQNFVFRLVFIVSLFLILILISQFLIPVNYTSISFFASMIFGTLIGTYLAGFIFKSSEIIEDHSESLEDKFDEVIEKGKDFIQDIKAKEPDAVERAQEEIQPEKKQEKSARERLKDKGYLK